MEDQDLSRVWLVVAEPGAAWAFAYHGRVRLLEPFMQRPTSLKEAADALETPLNTLYYYVQRFVASGLLTVATVQRRGGRPIKRYRAVAEAFFVPFSATPHADLHEYLRERDAALWPLLHRSAAAFYASQAAAGAVWGRRFEWPNGRLEAHTGPAPDTPFELLEFLAQETTPAFLLSWDLTQLEPDDAKAFQRELLGLYERYGGRAGTGQRYLVHMALVPLEEGR